MSERNSLSWVKNLIDKEYSIFELIHEPIVHVISLFPISFLNLLGPKNLFILSRCSKSCMTYLRASFPGLLAPNLDYDFHKYDPWGRDFIKDIPNLGILGIRSMPSPDFRISRMIDSTNLVSSVIQNPSHVIILLDISGSTSAFCCNITDGPYQGHKTNLDVSKMFSSSIIEVIQKDTLSNKDLGITKISIFTFNQKVECLVSYQDVLSVEANVLDGIQSSGGTDYNSAIRTITEFCGNLPKETDNKLLVCTDCNCSVDEIVINSLLETGTCSLSTCFVQPGDIRTLTQISQFAGSGIHRELPLDFTNENTVDLWCDMAAEFLTLNPISVINVINPDKTISSYKVSSIDEIIPESVRPVYGTDEIYHKNAIKCTVSDITGKRDVCTKIKHCQNLPSHEMFSLVLGKMIASLQSDFTKKKLEKREAYYDEISFKNISANISSIRESIKYNGFLIWVSDNSTEFSSCAIKIQGLMRGFIWRKKFSFLSTLICNGNWRTGNNAASIIQKFYRKNRDDDDLPGLLPNFLNHNDGFELNFQNNNFGFNFLQPPPLFPRTQRRFGRVGNYSSESLEDKRLKFYEDLLKKCRQLKEYQDKIDSFDKDKNRKELENILLRFRQMLNVIVSGITSDKEVLETGLQLPIDSIDVNLSRSIVFHHGNIKVHIPIAKFSKYELYSNLLVKLQMEIRSIQRYLDQYDSDTGGLFNPFDVPDFHVPQEPPILGVPRQCTVHQVPSLMRQTSQGISNCGAMSALRSVSNAPAY